jgi:hypothetical protein
MNERQPEPTFFVDQNLIGEFVAHLRLAGLKVEQLEDHLDPTVGRWSKDRAGRAPMHLCPLGRPALRNLTLPLHKWRGRVLDRRNV